MLPVAYPSCCYGCRALRARASRRDRVSRIHAEIDPIAESLGFEDRLDSEILPRVVTALVGFEAAVQKHVAVHSGDKLGFATAFGR